MSKSKNVPTTWERKLIITDGPMSRENLLALAEQGHFRIIKELKLVDGFLCEFQSRGDGPSLLGEQPGISEVMEDIKVKLITPDKGVKYDKSSAYPHSSNANWGLKRIQADQVWKLSTGKYVKAAIIDTGISYKHPDLRQAIRGGINILNPDRPPEDDNGHGTNVAGIIGCRGSVTGLSGIAPDVELYVVKSFNSDGEANLSDIVEGLEWCLKQGIKLVNLSFGLPKDHKVLRKLVEKSTEQGMLLVCAAGNEGGSDSVMYPGKYTETICVSALTPGDRLASFSSTGPEVDFIAPGKDIMTTEARGKYSLKNGTSFAAPHVTGVLALMLSFMECPLCKKRVTTAQLLDILRNTTQHLPGLTQEEQGYGLVNALQAMARLVRS